MRTAREQVDLQVAETNNATIYGGGEHFTPQDVVDGIDRSHLQSLSYRPLFSPTPKRKGMIAMSYEDYPQSPPRRPERPPRPLDPPAHPPAPPRPPNYPQPEPPIRVVNRTPVVGAEDFDGK